MLESTTSLQPEMKLYKYRWVILFLYTLYAGINFIQYLHYSSVKNIVAKYYNATNFEIDLTGVIFLIAYILFFLPCNYLLAKFSLKVTGLISSGLTTLGVLIKLGTVSPHRFYVVLIAQALCGLGEIFMVSVPSKLASTWFGPNEVSKACALSILGTQVGLALGSVIPPLVLGSTDNIHQIEHGMNTLNIYNAVISAVIFFIILIFFKAKPEMPPSLSQSELNEQPPNVDFIQEVKLCMTNKDFLWILFALGLAQGVWNCFALMINTVYLNYFPHSETEVGYISLLTILSGGCVGSFVFGFILDKTHAFKATAFAILIGATISYGFATMALEMRSKVGTFITVIIYGFFVASCWVVGFEYSVEVTYPMSENTPCSIMNCVLYVTAIALTYIFEVLFDKLGFLYTNILTTIILLICSVSVYFIRSNLKRLEANSKNKS